MSSAAATQTIHAMPLFSGLSEKEKDELINGGRIRQCSRGEHLFLHGDPVKSFYIICKGTVQLFRETPDGHEKTIDVVKSGQTMCESEILDSCRNHRVNAMALNEVSVMEFPVTWLKDSARKYSAFALNLLSHIAQQAHMAEVEAEQRANMKAAQLVACFLQRICVLYDFDPKGFELPYSKTIIASRIGMELETFSRTLSKLKEHGIIVKGSHVSITDLERVEQYVCATCSIAEDCPTHQEMERKCTAKKDSCA